MVHNSFEADSFYVTAYKGTLISQFAKADRLDASSFSFSFWSPPFSLFFQLYIAHVRACVCVEGVCVCCELGQSDPRFFLTRRCRRCRRHDGSSMLSRIRQSTPLYLLLALPSCFFLSCLLLRYVSTFERDVFAEGEESLRREFIMRGFMGSLKGSLFGIIYFLRYY